jgi:hypothetical protein
VLSALAVLLLLASDAADEKPPARIPRGFSLRLDAGGFLGAGWGTQIYRDQINQLKDQGITFWAQGTEPDSQLVVRSLPIAGPLVTLEYGGKLARAEAAELVLTSALQAVGLAMLTYQAFMINEPSEPPAALELSISPLVAGHLGLSLSLLW